MSTNTIFLSSIHVLVDMESLESSSLEWSFF